MAFRSAEDELEEFLASQSPKLRKLLQLDCSLSKDELSDFWWWMHICDGRFQNKYESIVRRIPHKWGQYCKRCKQAVLMRVPRKKRGRHRTSEKEEAEILALEAQGFSQAEIAKRVGLTKETVRKRLKTAKKHMPPDQR